MRVIGIAAAAALLAGCGSSTNQAAAAEKKPAAALQPGEYELSWSDIDMKPAAPTQAGSTPAADPTIASAAFPARACVAAGGDIDAVAFAREGDTCRTTNGYVRNGKINVQLACTRDGEDGPIMQLADGSFTEDSFDAQVATTTYFKSTGNYTMTRKVTARRVGACTDADA